MAIEKINATEPASSNRSTMYTATCVLSESPVFFATR